MKIDGSIALVTGASDGIGREIALALARRGARVGLIARRREQLEETARTVAGRGGRSLALPCDVTDPEAVEAAVATAERELGPIGILVNSAGLGIWRPFASVSTDEHRRMMEVNYWGTFHAIRAVLPAMRRRRRGAIVNLIAGSGKFALPVTSGYSASKFAVAGLTEALRRELGGSGIAVSGVFPGSVRTSFWDDDRIERTALPPLVRWAPKLAPGAVARAVVLVIRLGLAERTLPVFVGVAARLNALWVRFGDLLFSRWLLPVGLGVVLLRWLAAR
jgi:NAD(P)-dependent dehydrogenase (short-subunit alcohol dehydrogenase family)